MPQSTVNLFLSGLMGLLGGFFTIPINALISWWLKRDEQLLQHKLDMIAKQRELLLQHQYEQREMVLQHQLEISRTARDDELVDLKAAIVRLEQRVFGV